MKRSIVLSFILLSFSSVSWGQGSACPAGHEDLCKHPTPSPRPSPSPPPSGRQQSDDDDDNLTVGQRANQKIDPAVEAKNSFKETQNSYYFTQAKNLLDQAFQIKPNDGRAFIVLLELVAARANRDHEEVWQVAQQARDHAEFSSGYRRKYLHDWFTLVAAEEYEFYLEDWQAKNCNLHTSASTGSAVDPGSNVMAQVRGCQKAANLQTEAIKDRNKIQAKYHKKYDKEN